MFNQAMLVAFALLLPATAVTQRRPAAQRPDRPVVVEQHRVEGRSPRLDRSRGLERSPRLDRRRSTLRAPVRRAPRAQRTNPAAQRSHRIGRPWARPHPRHARRVQVHRHARVWVPGHFEVVRHPPRYRWTYRCGRPVRVMVSAGWVERVWVPGHYR